MYVIIRSSVLKIQQAFAIYAMDKSRQTLQIFPADSVFLVPGKPVCTQDPGKGPVFRQVAMPDGAEYHSAKATDSISNRIAR